MKELLHKSADDRTILMHAAKSGDAMLLKMVGDTCRLYLSPGQVWSKRNRTIKPKYLEIIACLVIHLTP